ncbi:hypothetical protein BH11ACT8_BH11ACT8_19260 [soil metagenome]
MDPAAHGRSPHRARGPFGVVTTGYSGRPVGGAWAGRSGRVVCRPSPPPGQRCDFERFDDLDARGDFCDFGLFA